MLILSQSLKSWFQLYENFSLGTYLKIGLAVLLPMPCRYLFPNKTMKPVNEYPKRILIAVSGMSPQIVTETLYATAVMEKQNPFVPTEIHLITTREGARRAKLQLLHSETGKFHLLRQDYGLPEINFSEKNIHIISDNNGNLLDDIKTPQSNEAAADFITHVVNELTRDKNSIIHASIAGGRKTMGYYLGYALSLYGRAQDKLSHVLVTEKYEGLPDFFYPTPTSQVIHDREKIPLDTKEAQVMLAEIPFVRLRSGLPENLLTGKAGFNESVTFARSVEAEPKLEIDFKKQCFYANGVKVTMTATNFAFYIWMIEQTVELGEPVYRQVEADKNYVASFLASAENSLINKDIDNRSYGVLSKDGMEANWISERISLIRKAFEKVLGKQMAKSYAIQSNGSKNKIFYTIPLSSKQIKHRGIKTG